MKKHENVCSDKNKDTARWCPSVLSIPTTNWTGERKHLQAGCDEVHSMTLRKNPLICRSAGPLTLSLTSEWMFTRARAYDRSDVLVVRQPTQDHLKIKNYMWFVWQVAWNNFKLKKFWNFVLESGKFLMETNHFSTLQGQNYLWCLSQALLVVCHPQWFTRLKYESRDSYCVATRQQIRMHEIPCKQSTYTSSNTILFFSVHSKAVLSCTNPPSTLKRSSYLLSSRTLRWCMPNICWT